MKTEPIIIPMGDGTDFVLLPLAERQARNMALADLLRSDDVAPAKPDRRKPRRLPWRKAAGQHWMGWGDGGRS